MSTNTTVYIIEDDEYYAEYIKYAVKLVGEIEVTVFHTALDFLNAIKKSIPDIISLDYNLPDRKGNELFSEVKKLAPKSEIIIVSSQEEVDVAIQLMKEGAFDYIVKNSDAKNRIVHAINNYKKQSALKQQIVQLEEAVDLKFNPQKLIVSNDSSMNPIFELIKKAAQSSINVSITGDTGTGKELVAKSIHFNSVHKKGPFIAVNLAAIPESLIEAELFGHVKGAFTGAIDNRTGYLEEAKDGTLFLDEIGEIAPSLQVKLLRVLQEREFSRVGSTKKINLESRVICATNKDLIELVKEGKFREDLYYRLIGLPIKLPALIDRGNDAVFLAEHFIADKGLTFNNEALQKLAKHHWPGNIRELKAVVELASVLADRGIISATNIVIDTRIEPDDFSVQNLTLKEINERVILRLLDKNNNNVRKVARLLDIGKSTIYRMLQENNIEFQK